MGKGDWQNPWGSPPPGGSGPGNTGRGNPPPPPDWEDLLRKSQDRFNRMFPGGGDNKRSLMLVGAAALLLWIGSGIYLVKADELGVVTRFGSYHETTLPGLHIHLPFPIEKVQTPKVTTVNRVEVGFYSSAGYRGSDTSVPEESLMLTGDENIIDTNFEVQWKIDDAAAYLFNVRDPEDTVKAVAESAMREVIGKTQIMSVLSEGEAKFKVEQDTRDLMQKTLNSYKSGIEIVVVNLLKADPPAEVIESFRDVQSARADQETERNKALAYRNDILPRARGQAEQMIQESQAYKQEVVARAQGEAARFTSVYEEYKLAPDVTRKRMYIEAMENVMDGMNKVIVDEKAGSGVLPFLPLNELRPKPAGVSP